MTISACVTTITPALAQEWLKLNTKNRVLRPHRVSTFARDMKMGRWMLNGEAITFSDLGRLLNGQHRLHACVEANRSFETVVMRGVPDKSFPTIDTGGKRTAGDVLGMSGIKYSGIVGG